MTRKTLIGLMSAILIATPLAGQSSANTGSSREEGPAVTSGAQTFLGAFQAIRDYGLEAVGDSALWDRAVEGLIRELADPYAQVFTPAEFDQFQEDNTGNYAGIGVQITTLNEAITITAVFRGTPAERSGVQVGDLIIGVNDQSTEGWTTGMASDSIRGGVGTSVKLALARAGLMAPLTPTIPRDSVHVSAVVSGMVDSDVGYIALDRIARASSEEVDSALVKFQSSRGVILDLRGNPGGYLDESLMIGDLFLDRGLRLASAESRVRGESERNQDEAWDARMPDHFPDKPVIVLVDRFSASAAEIVAGALQDHDRALVIGERTFGKGVFQNVFRLTEKRHLRLTTGEWFTPLGRSLHRPRTAQGRPVPEDPDTFPVIKTKAGRELIAGGGIFPDLKIANDTLTLVEREFLSQAAREEIPLVLRIEEFAFSQADSRRNSGMETGVDADDLKGFIDALGDEGIDEEYLENPLIASYLEWRISIRVAERMDRMGQSIAFRSQRDPVVAEAIRLLKSVGTQEDLFVAADRVKATQEDTGASPTAGPEGS